jgi:branched-chain amino acid transport system ATP-binding protein
MNPLLETNDLSMTFGGLKAVQNVSFQVYPEQIFSVIGPNGAGKTTLFNCLSGLYQPTQGRIFFQAQDITRKAAHERCRLGLARTFQNIRLFAEMTALENVQVGQFSQHRPSPWSMLARTSTYCRREKQAEQEARELLDFVGLSAQAGAWARNLAYGLQRRLEIARALATKPKVLLLDEPGAGMNPQEIGEMIQLIERIRQRGLAIILIEHHMKVVMSISHKILVLDHGEAIASGSSEEIRRDPKVIAAYLGQEATHA